MSDYIASSVLDIPSTVRIIRFVVDMLKSMLVVWDLGEERATEETESPQTVTSLMVCAQSQPHLSKTSSQQVNDINHEERPKEIMISTT